MGSEVLIRCFCGAKTRDFLFSRERLQTKKLEKRIYDGFAELEGCRIELHTMDGDVMTDTMKLRTAVAMFYLEPANHGKPFLMRVEKHRGADKTVKER